MKLLEPINLVVWKVKCVNSVLYIIWHLTDWKVTACNAFEIWQCRICVWLGDWFNWSAPNIWRFGFPILPHCSTLPFVLKKLSVHCWLPSRFMNWGPGSGTNKAVDAQCLVLATEMGVSKTQISWALCFIKRKHWPCKWLPSLVLEPTSLEKSSYILNGLAKLPLC